MNNTEQITELLKDRRAALQAVVYRKNTLTTQETKLQEDIKFCEGALEDLAAASLHAQQLAVPVV